MVVAGASDAPAQQWQDVAVPRTLPDVRPVFSRRRVLAGGAALAVLGMTAPACSSPPAPPAVDELEAQLQRARHDSELAAAAAVAADKPVSPALTEVASERGRHAQALRRQAQARGLTLPTLLAAVYADVLARWSRNQHFCITVTSFNRPDLHPAGVVIVHRLLTRPGHSPLYNPDIDELRLDDALHRVEACRGVQITP